MQRCNSRYSRRTRASTRPSSVASAWTVPEIHARKEEVDATKDVADIVRSLLHADAVAEDAERPPPPSATMVLQCLEVVMMKLQSEAPARLAAQMDRLLEPVASSAAQEIQAGKQHRPRLLKEVEELQERLQYYRTALDAAKHRSSELDLQHHRLLELSQEKLDEGVKKCHLEEEQVRLATELYQMFQKKSLEQAERRQQEQRTQRQLISNGVEGLTGGIARLRREYDVEKQAVRKLKEEVAQLAHERDVALLQIADLQEMELLSNQLEAKRAELQDEMTVLLGQGGRRATRTTIAALKPM